MKNLKQALMSSLETLNVPTVNEQIETIKSAFPLLFTESVYQKIKIQAPAQIIVRNGPEIYVNVLGIAAKNVREMFLTYYDQVLPYHYHMIRLNETHKSKLRFSGELEVHPVELKWVTFNPDTPNTNTFLAFLHQWNLRYQIFNLNTERIEVSLEDIGFKDYAIGEHKDTAVYKYQIFFCPRTNIIGYDVTADEFGDLLKE